MKDERFKQILFEKESIQLDEDFDTKMMSIIKKHATNKAESRKEIILMYIFFIFVLIFGLVLVNQFVDLRSYPLNNIMDINSLVLIPYIVIILFLFEKVYSATLVYLGKEMFSIK